MQIEGVDKAGHGEAGYKSAVKSKSDTSKSVAVVGNGKKSDYSESSIVIIGMRGAGKSHMGKSAAKSLGRIFIDSDDYFDSQIGKSIASFVAENSWDEFRKIEASQLKEILKKYPTGHVISCGGGIVETQSGRSVLEEWCKKGGVINLTRDINEVVDYLTADKTRPVLGEDPISIWQRRRPFYKACSNAEFMIVTDGSEASWKATEQDFSRFIKFGISTKGMFQISGDLSFFVCLTFPDVRNGLEILNFAAEGANAFELRVDLLKEWTDEFVGSQIAHVRRHSKLPIIFTVRTKSQGGRFPDNELPKMFSLLELGLKFHCEFVDVEVLDSKSEEFVKLYRILIKNKGNSHLISSYHDFSGTAVWDPIGPSNTNGHNHVSMRDKYVELYPFGDSVKLVGKANSLDDNFALHRFKHHIIPSLDLKPSKRLIAINMGSVGQISRALNDYMTPVTHPSLPTNAAPGQLSIKQIHETRTLLGLIPTKNFYLFGFPIASSMSPTLHNTGFETLGLPHKYSISEHENWTYVKTVLEDGVKNGTFGGASVTIPHKEEIIKHGLVSSLTDAAKKIGAVNTILLGEDGASLVGDNTDWLGIRAAILKRVLGSVGDDYGSVIEGYDITGGVIGAGGTSRAACFALNSLGTTDLRIWNRTEQKAQALATEFNGRAVVTGFETLFNTTDTAVRGEVKPKLFLLVSSVPGASQTELPIDTLFESVNTSAPPGSVGVFIEMAYRPRKTLIIEHLDSIERPNISWSYAEGVEILIEQGLEQFTRWTGRVAPRKAIEKAVYANYK
ncbi:3-dehydroquinate dehydratase (3-dehydroquinase) [Physocladia obscura]|uniref:shikimate kinase n=1 Tax=Physocladia obscura TaxID=109957 RepID=A0AAD5XF52_9FUNG|nr:3-dehydroquinate dehydratase (3-dehydroquinase) [Physocladia obscura]